jgi:pimeloyl-ACP methyl ester carboxylesterase
MEHFFNRVDAPVLVVHEESDSVTPIAHIRESLPTRDRFTTFFTSGQDHNLTAPETPNRIVQFLTKDEKESLCI